MILYNEITYPVFKCVDHKIVKDKNVKEQQHFRNSIE